MKRIESHDLAVEDLFSNFYSVPAFQREFVWKSENVEQLLSDVFEEFREAGKDAEYFIGSIVVCKGPQDVFELIDGQQRLTTIYLTLCCIRDYLINHDVEPSATLNNQIYSTYLDKDGDDVNQFRLTLQYQDSRNVLEKIGRETIDVTAIEVETESIRNLVDAYQTIYTFFNEKFATRTDDLKKFHVNLTRRVKIIRIEAPDEDQALEVFETINERGIGLNAMDLLKNRLFIHAKQREFDQLKERWKALVSTLEGCKEKPLRFLRYYILSRFDVDRKKGISEDQIFEWFMDHADDPELNIKSAPLAFVDDLLSNAKDYAQFVEGNDPTGTEVRPLKNIGYMTNRAGRQHFVLLLAARHLQTALFKELCRNLENIMFCSVVAGEGGKDFERNFSHWAKELRAVNDELGLNRMISEKMMPELVARSNDFDFAFREMGEDRIQKYRLRYILAKLTQHVEELAWGNPARSDLAGYLDRTVHIEHILPQRPESKVFDSFDKPKQYDEFCRKLGNLTLLERTINTSVSNRDYDEKVPGYKNSAFLLTKSLVIQPRVGKNTELNRAVSELPQFKSWNSKAIEQRQEILAKLAREVWRIPKAQSLPKAA